MSRPPGVQPLFGVWRRSARRASPDATTTGAATARTDSRPARRQRSFVSRLMIPAAVVVIAVAVSLVAVPTRAHLDRTSQIAEAEVQLAELVRSNQADERRLEAMDTDAELERLARKDFGLAMPGEEVYRVLPAPRDPLPIPQGWPFNYLGLRLVQP